MTGSLLPEFVFRAIDSAGLAMSGAQLFFYNTGTLTPQSVFTTSAVSVAHPNPLVADSGGLFPPIYPDPTKTYRAIMKSAGGVTIQDIDPVFAPQVNAAGSITASMLASGAAVSNIGYTPVNKAGDGLSGELTIGYALTATAAAGSVGFRGMERVTKNAAYTFNFDDSARMLRHTDANPYAWTIPNSSTVNFQWGTTIPIRNFGSGIITLTRAGSVSLRIAGSTTDQNVALAQWAFGAIVKEDTDVWLWSGTGGS